MRSLMLTWFRNFNARLEIRPCGLLIFSLPVNDLDLTKYKFVKMEAETESQNFIFYLHKVK